MMLSNSGRLAAVGLAVILVLALGWLLLGKKQSYSPSYGPSGQYRFSGTVDVQRVESQQDREAGETLDRLDRKYSQYK